MCYALRTTPFVEGAARFALIKIREVFNYLSGYELLYGMVCRFWSDEAYYVVLRIVLRGDESRDPSLVEIKVYPEKFPRIWRYSLQLLDGTDHFGAGSFKSISGHPSPGCDYKPLGIDDKRRFRARKAKAPCKTTFPVGKLLRLHLHVRGGSVPGSICFRCLCPRRS